MRSLRTVALLFVATGVPFGLLSGAAAGFVIDSARAGLATGIGAGLVFGGLMAVLLGSLDAVADRAPQDARRGPRQDTTVPVRGGADLPDRIVAVLRGLPAEIREADVGAGRYRARTRWSWKSFGEEVTVQLTGDPSAPRVVVSSRPVIATTVVDYGKGRSNVAEVADALRRGHCPTGDRGPAAGQSGVTIAGRFDAALDDVDESGLRGPELLPVRLARACARTLRVDGAGISLVDSAQQRVPSARAPTRRPSPNGSSSPSAPGPA
ncbi:hypothetical protein [Blastococcus brunescens]|uniref:DUF1499 domain-containing protein n=1 Tax=Blastococcus brunescens TaxID=1564165 RepID=A0ABZ1B7D7_9ACTN|nr:hypothetical protein [Blastococcus sp. BMG 8361]WRL64945.1 hypothetical protein U6N30_04255 [Blastococcus sp. BMG 8361]